MPRPDPRAPRDGQESMFEALPTSQPGQVLRGRHSAAVDAALAAARDAELIGAPDDALATFVRSAAWAVDAFEAQNKPYGPAKLLQPVTDALRELRMTPDSRQTETDDSIKDLLHELAQADSGAEASHPEDTEPADVRPEGR